LDREGVRIQAQVMSVDCGHHWDGNFRSMLEESRWM
jgi:hypothetical protein